MPEKSVLESKVGILPAFLPPSPQPYGQNEPLSSTFMHF